MNTKIESIIYKLPTKSRPQLAWEPRCRDGSRRGLVCGCKCGCGHQPVCPGLGPGDEAPLLSWDPGDPGSHPVGTEQVLSHPEIMQMFAGLFRILWFYVLSLSHLVWSGECFVVVVVAQSPSRIWPFVPHGLQHVRLLCPPLSPGICSNSCPLSRWCRPIISSSVAPFSSCLNLT